MDVVPNMGVVVINMQGQISDINMNIEYVKELSNDTSYETIQIAYIDSDKCNIMAIHERDMKKNSHASNLTSKTLYGNVFIFGAVEGNAKNIDLDYLGSSLINTMSLKDKLPEKQNSKNTEMKVIPSKKFSDSELINYSYYSDDLTDDYYDQMEKGYDSY